MSITISINIEVDPALKDVSVGSVSVDMMKEQLEKLHSAMAEFKVAMGNEIKFKVVNGR